MRTLLPGGGALLAPRPRRHKARASGSSSLVVCQAREQPFAIRRVQPQARASRAQESAPVPSGEKELGQLAVPLAPAGDD